MREIKFRAFNKAERKMCRVVSIDFTGFITVRFPEFEHESDDYNDQMSIEEFEPLMQFTGLKDKNGREIYEGDIVRGKYGKNGIVKNYEIRWLIGHFAAVDRNNITGDEHYYPIGLLEGEVIGNIYENKHLL